VEALLDACSISYFFQAGQKELIEHLASVVRVHVVEQVFDELERETTWGAGFKKLFDGLVERGRCEVHALAPGTEEAMLFNRLRAGAKSGSPKDQGERASIALAVHHADLVFVTEDRGALHLALRELPGFPCRVTRTAGWLRAMAERGARLDSNALMEWAKKVPGQPALPHWWQSWVGEQAGKGRPSHH